MGVPGYKYDLAFNAQAVPLAPLVNTFQPERKGQIGGTFSATAKISGTGSTGEALQKTLTGQFDMSSTNLNLSVNNVKTKWIKEIVMVVVAIPDLLKGQNLLAAGTSLVQNLANQNKASSSNDLSKSPINAIVARGNAGSGKVTLQQVTIQSPAFRADVNGGTITLAPILTNSALNIPVSVALSQSIARPLNLVSADTPTNAPYAKLPDFFKEVGTIGEPKRDINAMALIKVAAQGLSGVIPHLGGQSGSKGQNLLQGLGGLLGGNPPANNNAPTNTNAPPATNPPPAQEKPLNNLLNNFLKPRK
jgi:hypothetical protein